MLLLWLSVCLAWAGPKEKRAERKDALRLQEVVVAEPTDALVRAKRHEAIVLLEGLLADDDQTLPLLDAYPDEP